MSKSEDVDSCDRAETLSCTEEVPYYTSHQITSHDGSGRRCAADGIYWVSGEGFRDGTDAPSFRAVELTPQNITTMNVTSPTVRSNKGRSRTPAIDRIRYCTKEYMTLEE